jgi:hypothetical protein
MQKTYLLFIALLVSAILVAGCTGNAGTSTKELTVYDNITTAIEGSWYLNEHHLDLDPSSVMMLNMTPYGMETTQSFQFKTTDGSMHTGSMYLYENNSSNVRIMEIDGEYPE